MREPRAHFTEPLRQRPSVANESAATGSGTYGPTGGHPGALPTRSMDIAAGTSNGEPLPPPHRGLSALELDARGCVPTHRSVFRLFRRKGHSRSQSRTGAPPYSSDALSAGDGADANNNTITNASMSTTSTGEHGGYLRSRKGTRGTTLSAQRTRSEFAVASPPLQELEKSTHNSSSSSQTRLRNLRSTGSQSSTHPPAQPRAHKADKGTIVQLRSSPSEQRIAIPDVDDLHADAVAAGVGADSAPASLASSAEHGGCASNQARISWAEPPRKSASSTDMASLLRQLEAEVELQAASDDELVTASADVAVHVLPDDGSDWNSDFSSPTSWRRSGDRPPSRIVPRAADGSRLKDRAIDRGVLEAQHRILQQEKYLMQISNLSSSLAKLRPLILRCLVFELPDRGIRIGTSTFVSGLREPCGSIEPSVEEERLWELWRQAEALLTIMDNDNIPLSTIESRLTLSKKRAIMLAFCDWEQYSLYVQDAWDKARRGIQQPAVSAAASESRRSSGSIARYSGGFDLSGARRESLSSRASSFLPPSGRILSRFSLSKERKPRRRSVVGVAPASLQRIADEAQAVQEECEQLLALMSPLYRESQLSPRTTFYSPEIVIAAVSPNPTVPATTSAAAAAATVSTELPAIEADATAKTPSLTHTTGSLSASSCSNC
ncbi:hypothetical protein COEREDRAFT_94275 [Coemansia reversa NRRL 1564]|uniref:Uncharacterized protein n=1 Tax=Coemansia reversa (strain ATCC 12441 / NRRL 1564) TaxID=763665 RepID=A0A2G5B5F8_COERN|nr:hypothetical protein COEREDRAFT_94275 [Coemansia reversa NRRL 1564]|eukprot:PIA13957.1 hypothetical protein COEREDRAFT_94275 [Coemansia reversa NRRL 1564]